MIGIYKITNKINGNCYIGQSINILSRWSRHKYGYKNEDTRLYRSMRKHGIENYEFEIIEECEKDCLNERELYWINNIKPKYNTAGGGNSIYGFSLSEEHKQKLREANIGKKMPDNIKKKISKGLKSSSSYKEGIARRNFNKENHPSWGMKRTAQQRKKMSDSQIKYFNNLTEEQKKQRKEFFSKNNIEKLGKTVMCIETGEIFKSCSLAAKRFSTSGNMISYVCNGKRKSAKGYTFKYI